MVFYELVSVLMVLVAGLAILSKASERLIDSAIAIAHFFKVSDLAIGFLLVSVATSLPELVVSIFASASGHPGLSIGNVLGANISDLAMVLGVSALIAKLRVKKNEHGDFLKTLILVSVLSIGLLFIVPSFFEGLFLLAIFAVFCYFVLKTESSLDLEENKVTRLELVGELILFFVSLTLVLLSADWIINSSVNLAFLGGFSEAFVGATIVSLGTTVPELAVSLKALKTKKTDLALGNLFGSAITNLTLVLGSAAIVSQIIVSFNTLVVLVFFALLVNVSLYYFVSTRSVIHKKEGLLLLGLYALFIITSFLVQGI
ncbi:sodium:calcium antiporter [Candidatus Micrarchaeota archaeon]|nr:sodium:calcium antiporter [Candidatus Micrarchaeota archaeon]